MAGDFLDIFLRFWVLWGSFSYKIFSYKNTCKQEGLWNFIDQVRNNGWIKLQKWKQQRCHL